MEDSDDLDEDDLSFKKYIFLYKSIPLVKSLNVRKKAELQLKMHQLCVEAAYMG